MAEGPPAPCLHHWPTECCSEAALTRKMRSPAAPRQQLQRKWVPQTLGRLGWWVVFAFGRRGLGLGQEPFALMRAQTSRAIVATVSINSSA